MFWLAQRHVVMAVNMFTRPRIDLAANDKVMDCKHISDSNKMKVFAAEVIANFAAV